METKLENKNKTPTGYNKKYKTSTCTTPKYSSPLSDIVGIDWDEDDVDDMLSQVDISGIYGQDVITNTQRSDVEQSDVMILQENINVCNNDDSFVTESWDFDDNSDELIQTLEQVERTQTSSRVAHVEQIVHSEKQPTVHSEKEQSKCLNTKDVDNNTSTQVKCSKEDIERKRLEAQQKRKQRLQLQNNRPNLRQSKYTTRK